MNVIPEHRIITKYFIFMTVSVEKVVVKINCTLQGSHTEWKYLKSYRNIKLNTTNTLLIKINYIKNIFLFQMWRNLSCFNSHLAIRATQRTCHILILALLVATLEEKERITLFIESVRLCIYFRKWNVRNYTA